MSTSNYFTVSGTPVFFDDFERNSVDRAYSEACAIRARKTRELPTGERVVPPMHTYREPIEDGAWRDVPYLFRDDEIGPRFKSRVKGPDCGDPTCAQSGTAHVDCDLTPKQNARILGGEAA